ncbi:MAG: hypothetical protein ACTSQW_06750, partial [Promethearchaeota archaeon]
MKSNHRNLSLGILLVITLLCSITPVALAKTRQSHLIDFMYENQNSDGSFGVASQDTAYATEIIDHFDAYVAEVLFGQTKSIDIPTFI